MINILKKFERFVTGVLLVLLALVIILALVELGWLLVKDVLKPPVFILEVDDLLDIFGVFLLVLIGLELVETIKQYYIDGRIELKVIFAVALTALGRKIIILEPEKFEGMTLIGLGVIIFALVAGYFVVSKKGLSYQVDRSSSEAVEK